MVKIWLIVWLATAGHPNVKLYDMEQADDATCFKNAAKVWNDSLKPDFLGPGHSLSDFDDYELSIACVRETNNGKPL